MLEQYEAKNAPYREILASRNPGRARDYWASAESFLREAGIIELEPDNSPRLPRKGWQDIWLSECPPWRPGPLLQPILKQLAAKNFRPNRVRWEKPRRDGADLAKFKRHQTKFPGTIPKTVGESQKIAALFLKLWE